MSAIIGYVAAGIIAAWGVIHAAPTSRVLVSFAPITTANRLTIKQEWLAEAFTMWGVAAILVAVTAAGGSATARDWVYRAAAGLLISLGALTAFTGARTPIIWFKVCVFLLAGSGALLLAASAI